VRAVQNLKRRDAVLLQQLRQWEDQTIGLIQEFFPQYLDLAWSRAEPQSDAVKWSAGRVWECLMKNYGIVRVSQADPFPREPAQPVVKWFARATQGKFLSPHDAIWRAPKWFARSKVGAYRKLCKYSANMALRFDDALGDLERYARLNISARAQQSASAQPNAALDNHPTFDVSDDYRTITYQDRTHYLTQNQAAMMRELHANYILGRATTKNSLLAAIQSETSQVKDSWKRSPLWGSLVVSCKNGLYRLNIPGLAKRKS
jgi:hypothetical protein